MFALEWTKSKLCGVYFSGVYKGNLVNTQRLSDVFMLPDYATAEKLLTVIQEVYSAEYHIVQISITD